MNGRPWRFWLNHDGLGNDPTIAVGRILSLVAINIACSPLQREFPEVARIQESLVFFQPVPHSPVEPCPRRFFRGAPHTHPQNFIPLGFSKLQAGQRVILGPTAETPRADSLE